MIHSIMEVPHRYLRSGADESSHHSVLGKASMPRKLSDDVILCSHAILINKLNIIEKKQFNSLQLFYKLL